MDKSLKEKLREDLEYAHVQGDATNDEFKIVGEGEYEVAQDLRYSNVREDVEKAINYLVDKHAGTFGDRNGALGAVLSIIEKQYL